MSERVIAIIPAKGYSRRVPRKNMRLLHGKPLLAYTIEEALKSQLIDELYVSTDDPEIQAFSQRCGAKASSLRPAALSQDGVHGSVPILFLLEQLGGAHQYGYCVQLMATSPFKTAQTIDAVIQRSKDRHTNVLSVTPTGKIGAHFRMIAPDGTLTPLVQDLVYNFQTQDQPEVFFINGAIYCAPVGPLLQHRTFQYEQPMGYAMELREAFDIDTEEDFLMAERLADWAGRGVSHG